MENELSDPSVFNSQKHSHLILDQMARPGQLNALPEMQVIPIENSNQASIFIALTLLKAGLTYCVVGTNRHHLLDYLQANITASLEDASLADFVFIDGYEEATKLRTLKATSYRHSRGCATVIVDVDELSTLKYGQALEITLRGIGEVPDSKFYVSGLNPSILQNICAVDSDSSLAVHLILTDKENNFLYVPATTCFSWQPRLWLTTTKFSSLHGQHRIGGTRLES